MIDDLKKSLDTLHEKQDQQTEKISALEKAVSKQEVTIDHYAGMSDKMWSQMMTMNENLAAYNAQLQIHIAGVMELKEMNSLMREENKQRAIEIDSRLEIAERPIKWVGTTFLYLKWIGSALAGLAAIAALIVKIIEWLK